MKNPIFDLLLNFNGTINRRAYLAAIVLVLVTIGILQALLSFNILSTHIAHSQLYSSEEIVAHHIFDNLVWVFTPTLVPAHFLIFYSILVATVKRSRALELPKALTITLIVINSCFFSLLSKIHLIINYILNTNNDTQPYLMSQESVFYLSLAILILGLLINCFLIFNNKGKCSSSSINAALMQRKFDKENKFHNQFSYLFFIGRLILINTLIVSTLALSIYLFQDLFKDMIDDIFRNKEIVILSIVVIYSTIFLGLYLYATTKRLNDAGYKTYILVCYIIFIIFISGLFTYIVNLSSLTTQFLSLFLGISKFIVNIVVSSQIIPFLLSSNHKNEPAKSD